MRAITCDLFTVFRKKAFNFIFNQWDEVFIFAKFNQFGIVEVRSFTFSARVRSVLMANSIMRLDLRFVEGGKEEEIKLALEFSTINLNLARKC
jgi:hypothetical protein